MTEEQLLNAFVEPDRVQLEVVFKATDDDQHIVYGEVYAPYLLDTHGDMMEPEDVQQLAHRFLANHLNSQIDVRHNNKVIKAVGVESWIAPDNDPIWNPGAWVLGTFIEDAAVWKEVKNGTLGGYSMEAVVYPQPAVAEISVEKFVFGIVEDHGGHSHAFFAEIDDDGKVVRGYTSEDDGHSHEIQYGTRTQNTDSHSHRFFLT